MFAERLGETQEDRRRRIREEAELQQRSIAARDAEDAPSQAQQVAAAQESNRRRGLPLDYAAILKYRAIAPEQFAFLPSDEECCKALGLPEPVTLRNGETVEGEMTVGISEGAQSRTLKLKK